MAKFKHNIFAIFGPSATGYPVSAPDENNPPEGVSAVLWIKLCRMEEAIKGMVKKEEFHPVKLLVYGFTGSVLLGFTTGLIALVWVAGK